MSVLSRVARPAFLLLALLAGDARAATATGCLPRGSVTICGEGKDAILVFKDKISPTGQYAIGWRSSAGLPEADHEPLGDVSNVLVRLSDGRVMAELSSDDWLSGDMHANRKELKAFWSKDGRWLVSVFDERFGTSAIDVVAFDEADNVIGSGEVKALADRAAKADASHRAARHKVTGDLAYFALATEKHVLSDKGGRFRFNASLWEPKNGPSFRYRIDMRFKVSHTTVRADAISVKYVSFEPADSND
jgi:hypothetical protein